MSDMNRVFLVGRLTQDPKLRYTASKTPVANFAIASNRRTRQADGERREEVVFVDVTVWNQQAEACAEHLRKGRPVLVDGRLTMDQWTDDRGGKRVRLFITAESVQFLDARQAEPVAAGEEPSDEQLAGMGKSPATGPAAATDDDTPF